MKRRIISWTAASLIASSSHMQKACSVYFPISVGDWYSAAPAYLLYDPLYYRKNFRDLCYS